ncbi:HNH endonuclease [Actinoallomurus bryophytorum]|uniref:HNH endonuclease n=1 Tax=Actinoallomurus bryophytorum TaxID=1490222 RepID=UPI0016398F3F|nr:HNH endonuclease signature motif containing protein [Actinoallomurus bryophytorum]
MDALMRIPGTPLGGSLGVDAADLLGRDRFDPELLDHELLDRELLDRELPDRELVEVMIAARRLASRVQAVELAAVAELARRRRAEDDASGVEVISPREYLNDEVAAALTLTPTSADGLIRFATELVGRLPATFAALAAGDVDHLKARTLWQGTGQVSDEVAAAIEAKVLPRAPGQTTGEIRAKVRRLVKRLDPQALARRREEAERGRDVTLMETDDGTAHLSGVDLPADAAGAAYGRVAAIAAGLKRDGDGRRIDQLRADVFLALLRGTLRTTEPPADTSDRLVAGPDIPPDLGWSGTDDAIADAIAGAARTELSALASDLPTRHRHVGALIAQAGTRITESLAALRVRWCWSDHDSPHRDGAHRDGPHRDSPHRDGAHRDGAHRDGPHHDSPHRDGPHRDSPHRDGAHRDGAHRDGPHHDSPHRDGPHHDSPHRDGAHRDGAHRDSPHRDSPHRDGPHRHGPHHGALGSGDLGPGVPAYTDLEYGDPWHGDRVLRDLRASALEPRDLGHAVPGYRLPAAMRRLIEHRDRRCCFPGCRRPVRRCDADHSIPFHRGGATCPCNIAMLCRRHHRLKVTSGWHLEHLWPGVILWIGPTGHWKITAPADRE